MRPKSSTQKIICFFPGCVRFSRCLSLLLIAESKDWKEENITFSVMVAFVMVLYCVCVCVCVSAFVCACVCACFFVFAWSLVRLFVCLLVCVCVCVCVCVWSKTVWIAESTPTPLKPLPIQTTWNWSLFCLAGIWLFWNCWTLRLCLNFRVIWLCCAQITQKQTTFVQDGDAYEPRPWERQIILPPDPEFSRHSLRIQRKLLIMPYTIWKSRHHVFSALLMYSCTL